MIEFRKEKEFIVAKYFLRDGGDLDWLYHIIKSGRSQTFRKTFKFSEKELYVQIPEEIPFGYDEPVEFVFATIQGDYYKVAKTILTEKFDVYISTDIEITVDLFVAYDNTAIFKKIESLIDEDIFIGGSHPGRVPEDEFVQMINDFPNQYERSLYFDARVSTVLKNYFITTEDVPLKYQKYMNKKASVSGAKLRKTFEDTELIKYETILEKLERMLATENTYSELQWQKEILDIILLLYPKYIRAFSGTSIKSDKISGKFLDLLLLDANGNIDIIEIKKPFEDSIVTKGVYRNNHIPLRELSGTIMQIEKYIFYLNRWGDKGEKQLTAKYKESIPENMEIKIINPSAMIIMGRENNLSALQKRDFEVVKRKYKNIVDIITYDNLLERLKFTIEQIKLL